MTNANYSSINLYAQLPIVAEIRSKQSRPSFSAGAPVQSSGTTVPICDYNLHWDEETDYILRFWGSPPKYFQKLL